MANCREPSSKVACFTPDDGTNRVKIQHVTVFDERGAIIAAYYADEAGVVIDEDVYLGGGVAAIGECLPSAQEDTFKHVCMVDDIDGVPSNYVNYFQWVKESVTEDGVLTIALLENYTDETNTTIYTPVGAQQIDCCDAEEAGDDIIANKSGAITVTGASVYTPSANDTYLQSVSAVAFDGTVTGTDAFGNTFMLRDGMSHTWNADSSVPLVPPQFNIPAGVSLNVIWTEPATV